MTKLKSIFNGHTYTVLAVVFVAGGLVWKLDALESRINRIQPSMTQEQGEKLISEIEGLRSDLASMRVDAAVVKERMSLHIDSASYVWAKFDRRLETLEKDSVRWSRQGFRP